MLLKHLFTIIIGMLFHEMNHFHMNLNFDEKLKLVSIVKYSGDYNINRF